MGAGVLAAGEVRRIGAERSCRRGLRLRWGGDEGSVGEGVYVRERATIRGLSKEVRRVLFGCDQEGGRRRLINCVHCGSRESAATGGCGGSERREAPLRDRDVWRVATGGRHPSDVGRRRHFVLRVAVSLGDAAGGRM